MAGTLSKVLGPQLTCTCYELGHTWHPSCWQSFFEIVLATFKRALEVYTPIYVLAAVARKKGKDYFTQRMIPEILQSSLFLCANGSLYMGGFCVGRHILGRFFWWSPFLCSGLPASAMAISIERKSRRSMLALYLSNLAVETMYNMLKSRGKIKAVKNGEVLVFSVAMAFYMYFFKMKNGLDSSTQSAIKFIFGSSEIHPESEQQENRTDAAKPKSKRKLPPLLQYILDKLTLKNGAKHECCPHTHSCVHYILRGFFRNFVLGYGIQAALKFLGALTSAFKNPSRLYTAFITSDSVGLGLFLGFLTTLFRAVCCVLRWLRNQDDKSHGILAGFISAWSLVYYKSSSISLYVASKMAELLWFKGVDAGKLPYWRHGDTALYTVATAIVLHVAVFEPHNLRPAYWTFLLNLTAQRFADMNRRLIDAAGLGFDSSRLRPDFWPVYDPRYLKTIGPDPSTLSSVLKVS